LAEKKTDIKVNMKNEINPLPAKAENMETSE